MTFTEELRTMIFLATGMMTVVSAIMIIFLDNLLHAAISLFFTLIGIAVLYLLIGADFLGFSQVLMYAGGVLVLIIFGIFLTTPHVNEDPDVKNKVSTWITLGAGLLLLQLLIKMILQMPWIEQRARIKPTIQEIGDLLLSKYLLPFELISVLLLFALIGSILIIRKDLRK